MSKYSYNVDGLNEFIVWKNFKDIMAEKSVYSTVILLQLIFSIDLEPK